MDFSENIFVCMVLIVLFVGGVLTCHGIGLGIMWIRGRMVRRKRLYGIGRVL